MSENVNVKEIKVPLKECMIGDKDFYSKLFMVVIPMIIQNTLTNIVSLLDNVMVGRVGTLPMSAVAIVNQLLFVYYICIWGGIAGAGIYGAQFFGKGDMQGVKNTFRIKLLIATVITTLAMCILIFWGKDLFSMYIAADTVTEDRIATLSYGMGYLRIMYIGIIPFALTQCYAGTLRESGRTSLPMIGSMVAMIVNFVFNLLLIFGYLGFPKMGVLGAAVATVISRFVELAIIVIGTHRDKVHYGFMEGVYRELKIPGTLFNDVIKKAAPLLLNECLWAIGEAVILQLYSVRGINAIAAMNINGTVAQIFNEVFLSLGSAAGVLVGQALGANRLKDAIRDAWRIIFSSIAGCFIMGLALCLFAPLIPQVYNTSDTIRALATNLLIVSAIVMPLRGMTHASYFSIRSGGKTWITLIFDSCYSWLIVIPLGFVIAHFTNIPIVPFYAIIAGMELVKCVIAVILLKSRTWVKNIV